MAPRSALINVMSAAALKAAKGLVRDFGEVERLQVSKKGTANFVSSADLRAEKTLQVELAKARPGYGFLLEEGGEVAGSDPQFRWVIDPLDGTSNFLHAVPYFCISIGLEKKISDTRREIVAAVVYDPIQNEMFTAEKGQGAFLNDRRLTVSARKEMEQGLIVSGISRREDSDISKAYRVVEKISRAGGSVRFYGAAALDLAYVAAGRFDGFWHLSLKPWDLAAGMLLVQEAGGSVADLSDGADIFTSGHVLATNAQMHNALRTLITEAL